MKGFVVVFYVLFKSSRLLPAAHDADILASLR